MTALATSWLGLPLACPLVPSASPLTRSFDDLRRLEDAGAGAVVLGSLFAEQIEHEAFTFHAHLEAGAGCHPEAAGYLVHAQPEAFGPHDCLELVRRAKQSLAIPVIASLNAGALGAWVEHATLLEQAGADALELNVYRLETDPSVSGQQVEDEYAAIVAAVRARVRIPLAVKLSPFFSSIPALASRLDRLGVDGLVLFNRFYQPDIDVEQLEVAPSLELSRPFDGRLALRWIAILHGKVRASLGASTGVHAATDAVKLLMAGADVTMLCSLLLREGIQSLTRLRSELERWLGEHGYATVTQLRGTMSHRACPDPSALERANYLRSLLRWSANP